MKPKRHYASWSTPKGFEINDIPPAIVLQKEAWTDCPPQKEGKTASRTTNPISPFYHDEFPDIEDTGKAAQPFGVAAHVLIVAVAVGIFLILWWIWESVIAF